MKAADTPIAERWASFYMTVSTSEDPDASTFIDLIEELSRAEERVRVLEEALETARLFVPTNTIGDRLLHRSFDAALSTPAPEQSIFERVDQVARQMESAPDWKKGSPINERTPARAQPSAEKATPLTVQALDGSVLVEDRLRNLSVLALTSTEPLHIACPLDGQQWCFHTQAQADMFQEHLKRHATENATLKAREAATIATVNAAWADTVAALTAERDALKDGQSR